MTQAPLSPTINLSICPDNPETLVQAVSTRLKLSMNQQFVLEASDPAKHVDVKPLFPTPYTVRLALTRLHPRFIHFF